MQQILKDFPRLIAPEIPEIVPTGRIESGRLGPNKGFAVLLDTLLALGATTAQILFPGRLLSGAARMMETPALFMLFARG